MSRYTGPVYKRSRRFGFSILETGKEFSKGKKRTYPPGQHGQARRKNPSNYGAQNREKQKVRYMYGLNERQFRNTFRKALHMEGITGTNFLILLESRLDNLVFRLGFAPTRRAARQLVTHGHILLNNKKINMPSYIVKPGAKIELTEKISKNPKIAEALEQMHHTLDFVKLDKSHKHGEYVRFPERKELNQEINEALIVEHYSRLV